MLGGIGIGLPYPPPLGPALPTNQPYQPLATRLEMPPGSDFYLPAGWWNVRTGPYTMIQFLDPVLGLWIPHTTIGRNFTQISSDGSNYRIVNPTGCPIGALVTNNGTGYAQANTVITPSVGNSVWQAVVGNSLTAITVGNDPKGVAGGSNYTMPPIVDIGPPPPGGVQATATAALTAGAVSSVTLVNQGAGYTAGLPAMVIRPNPFDPNIGTITVPAITGTLGGGTAASGGINAIICTNLGSQLTGAQMAAMTLTITGNGASGAATPLFAMSITAVALSNAGGAGYAGTLGDIESIGGFLTTAAGSVVNPAISTGLLLPRKANIFSVITGGVFQPATIIDGGLFQVAPSGITLATSTASAGLPTTATAATFTMGGQTDHVIIESMGGVF